MRTRRTPVAPEHVGALNLIEIEFAKDGEVISSWKALLQHFSTQHGRYPEESVVDSMDQQERSQRNRIFEERLGQERARLLAKLLHAIAKRLGFRAEQLEIFEGGYTPQGWIDVDLEQRIIRRYGVDLAGGRAVLPISVSDFPKE
jgi:hypothetical protein